jgi:hypothetical protein
MTFLFRIVLVSVVDDHGGALASEYLCDTKADSAAGAGDDCNLIH